MKYFLRKPLAHAWEEIIALIKFGSRIIRHHSRVTGVVCVIILIGMVWFWKRPISGHGGLPIPGRLEVVVAPFFQEDSSWSGEPLGASCDTIGSAGCALCSAAMVLGSYGVLVNPKTLNKYLIEHNGYEGDAWIKWEVAATYPPDIAQHMYEDLPSYGLIDWNLLKGNPVIVRIRRATGKTHFVVIAGKQGLDYLVCDPAPKGLQGVYPFRELGAPIEALRFYRKKLHPQYSREELEK